jgi:TIR domain
MDPMGTALQPLSVFVSYRRRETAHLVGRICDRLVHEFDSENVFRDTDSIPRGTDFAAAIRHQLRSVDIVLAIIGPVWRETPLGEQEDYVYLELRLAVELDITVIPVLIDAATMPPESSLPDVIEPIVRRNAVTIGGDDHFRADCDVLVASIRSEVAAQRAGEAARRQFASPSATPATPVSAHPAVTRKSSSGDSPVLEPLGQPPRPPSSRSAVVGRARLVRLQAVPFNGTAGAKQSLTFRLDVADGSGNVVRTVGIEMRSFHIRGNVENDDWVEIDGIPKNGRVRSLRNLSTGQEVRARLF